MWCVCAVSIAGVLLRPRGSPEWLWALGGAAALVAFGLLPAREALAAAGRGGDVYCFLAGMMVLAELARREGVFDWVAGHAVHAARGSRMRLFVLVYLAGVAVTVVLSNDATAVVLTPAVAAAVRRAQAAPLPYLFSCAFIANAASFVLPISNPANLVVFANHLPHLAAWLGSFALPSLTSIVATFAALALMSSSDLTGKLEQVPAPAGLTPTGGITLGGIGATAFALIVASGFGAPLGAVTLVCAALVFAVVAVSDRPLLRNPAAGVSWGVLVLVAGLFVLVAGVEKTGALAAALHAVDVVANWPPWLGGAGVALAAALLSNVTNNLPAGLIAGNAVAHLGGGAALTGATAIGIDLGPNLSVTGSLATLLWLAALRRESIEVNAATFLRAGVVVMPPALIAALASLVFEPH